jgi:hypothetical protein
MKLYVLFEEGGYCDPARIVGVFDSFDKARIEKELPDNFGSEIVERELNVGQKTIWIPAGSWDNPPPAYRVMNPVYEMIAKTNPYAKLLEGQYGQS